MALRIVSTYQTVSGMAVLVVADVPPIDLLAMGRMTVFYAFKELKQPGRLTLHTDVRGIKEGGRKTLLRN